MNSNRRDFSSAACVFPRFQSGPLARLAPVALAGVVAIWALAVSGCKKAAPESSTPPAPPPQTNAPATNAPAANAPQPSPELQKLLGRWVRPDGGYVLEVASVDSGGKAEVGYFNPNPIKVSKAEARREAFASKLFVELRDSGYPGCTYNLTHEPQSDSLVGKYFQAAMQQEFDVVFVRMKQ